VHHWELARLRYQWLDDAAFEALRTDYLPADYRADATVWVPRIVTRPQGAET
jgi:predicted TIM-barrel fold metal-dependent hydrolase